MSDALLTGETKSASSTTQALSAGARRGILSGRQGRRVREALLAYLFLTPAFLVIGVFGLFPLVFAAFMSTHRGINRIPGTFDGLGNYITAIGDFTYLLGFWSILALIFLAVRALWRGAQEARAHNDAFWGWAAPGVAFGVMVSAALGWMIRLLPMLLDIPNQLRGARNTPENFQRLLGEALTAPQVMQMMGLMLGGLILGALTAWRMTRIRRRRYGNYTGSFTLATILLSLAGAIGWLTWAELERRIENSLSAGGGLDLASQMILISAGFLLLWLSWKLWRSAGHRESMASVIFRLMGSAALILGAWVLIAEAPRVIAQGDRVWWNALLATFYYSLGTIPPQLIVALILAVLLFQEIRGRSFFRVIYFLPYIAPFVGTAAVFKIIFSNRPTAPINSVLNFFGLPALGWINEPNGIFNLLTPGMSLPAWAGGPSLALVVIMIYGVWTFFGFNTVIFLAGLGNIPKETYEAAAIDGAGRWAQFRHITLPLLSPTIYFLTLYSVIGTFKAFNHIYVLRTGAALGTTDTASVVIFQTFQRDTRYGYASALAVLLLVVIIILTIINNRVAERRVHYG
ncbi:MAG: ABC transporter permease subunit [Caldilinea sp.]|nr:ABC transporter permease subunit [Caldilinea sp.]MDW8439278.1 ABC transporter permease subunit [Caldilineaceae bacterium]